MTVAFEHFEEVDAAQARRAMDALTAVSDWAMPRYGCQMEFIRPDGVFFSVAEAKAMEPVTTAPGKYLASGRAWMWWHDAQMMCDLPVEVVQEIDAALTRCDAPDVWRSIWSANPAHRPYAHAAEFGDEVPR